MQISTLDISIIIAYFVVAITLGIIVSKRAVKSLNSYFLGGNALPWWMLGVSDAGGMFDITGTMWLVYVLFVYGFKSIFLPWIWPTFNQIFLMVYLSIWLRKSKVMTGAQWIETRFGRSSGAKLAHIIVVIFALLSVIGFMAYAFKGIGKFASIFFPWHLPPEWYAVILMSLTAIYAVKGGMLSVVITELLQFVVLTVASIAIGIVAINMVSAQDIAAHIPQGWATPLFGWHLNLDWSGLIASVNDKIAKDGYNLFGWFFIMVLFQGVFKSIAGPAPNYDMQRILATRSPKEAAKMNWFVNVVLCVPRYMMISGITVLAIVAFSSKLAAMGPDPDFEQILPFIIRDILPVGLVGLLLAGLTAAFMSNYAATINAAPAYVVNDIYKRFINPDAPEHVYVRLSILTTIAFVIAGFIIGFRVDSINGITLWIVNELWGAYTAANLLKWYWWRLNGHGYFWGMATGIAASIVLPWAFGDSIPALWSFPIIFAVSFVATIIGSYLFKPESDEVLMRFYMQVRPWGIWKPVLHKVQRYYPDFQPNRRFKRDAFNIVVGILWQTSLVATPIALITKQFDILIAVLSIVAVTSVILKISWWDTLDDASAETLPADFEERVAKTAATAPVEA